MFKKYLDHLKLGWTNFFRMCPSCKRLFITEYSHSWIGGYNFLCRQATGRSGKRCYECGYIKWDQTDKEYEDSLPYWCKSHTDKNFQNYKRDESFINKT